MPVKPSQSFDTILCISDTAVSTAECMDSWGRPMSTEGTDTWAVEILPSVEPPATSDLLV